MFAKTSLLSVNLLEDIFREPLVATASATWRGAWWLGGMRTTVAAGGEAFGLERAGWSGGGCVAAVRGR